MSFTSPLVVDAAADDAVEDPAAVDATVAAALDGAALDAVVCAALPQPASMVVAIAAQSTIPTSFFLILFPPYKCYGFQLSDIIIREITPQLQESMKRKYPIFYDDAS